MLLPAAEICGFCGEFEELGRNAAAGMPELLAENTVSRTPEIITITRHPASSGSTMPSLVSGACSRPSRRRRRAARRSRW